MPSKNAGKLPNNTESRKRKVCELSLLKSSVNFKGKPSVGREACVIWI